MEQKLYRLFLNQKKPIVAQMYRIADDIHKSVNQLYDENKPYSHHLTMVADAVYMFGEHMFTETEDILPVMFSAYLHDTIEDARLNYYDVKKYAENVLNDSRQAELCAEIVYALTNEKGKTRAERANDKYYLGIRSTPYASFVKMCDRYANLKYSYDRMKKGSENGLKMFNMYKKEWPAFVEKVMNCQDTDDIRFDIPNALIDEIEMMFEENQE